jgi:pimeloyl-ACP methyl ester carboxylesterase
MTTDQLLLKTYFGWTSLVNPEKAAKQSFRLFQKVRKKTVRDREEAFFEASSQFTVPVVKTQLDCFELGNPSGDLVILVHGWDSNAGSLSRIAYALAAENKRVISFNLPGHAFSTSHHTNLVECKAALTALLHYLDPQKPFSVVAHSFGSAVATYTLSKTNYKIDKLVLLTNPNRIETIFREFKNGIGLGNRAFQKMVALSTARLGEPLANLSVEKNLSRIPYNNLLLIHDKFDKVLPYQHSVEVNDAIENAQLITIENIGHYKMLWNDEVIARCVGFVKGKEVF